MAIINIILLVIFGALLFIIALPLYILRRMKGTAQRWQGFHKVRKEGEVSVSGKDAGAGEKIVGDNIGEYVDYEEVEDKNKQ
jgi:hypothetical protein